MDTLNCAFSEGALVTFKDRTSSHDHEMIIWRIEKMKFFQPNSDRCLIKVVPVYGLFGGHLKISNRWTTADDLKPLDLQDLGAEYVSFTEFLKKISQ